jgi:hypothetical protein
MHPLEATTTTSEGIERKQQRLSHEDTNELAQLKELLWRNVNQNVFVGWSQGLKFSQEEPSALIQQTGGKQSHFLSIHVKLTTSNASFQDLVA